MSLQIVNSLTKQPQQLEELLKQGMSDKDIEQLLMSQYQDEFLVKNLMGEVKKMRNSQKTMVGLTLVLAGAFLMLLGFIFAFVGVGAGALIDVFLYGFTTVGLVIVFLGLVKIFN